MHTITEIKAWLEHHPAETEQYRLLWQSVLDNRFDVVLLLLSRGLNVNAQDKQGCSALHYAAQHEKYSAILSLLIAHRTLLLADSKGNTPLHYATLNKNLEAIEKLIKRNKKVDLTSRNYLQNTVLQIARIYRDEKMLINFLEHYGGIHDFEEVANIRDDVSLGLAVRSAAVMYLIAQGKITSLPSFFNPDYIDSEGNNSILVAVSSGQNSLISRLIQSGHSLEVKNKKGRGLILMAVYHGHAETLRLLLRAKDKGGYGLSLNVKTLGGDSDPVLVAVMNGQIEMLKLLLQPVAESGYGLSLSTKNNSGLDPILMAISYGQIAMLKLLLLPVAEGGYGLSLDVKDNFGQGPVLGAVANGRITTLKMLLAPISEGGYGLSLDVKENDDCGPVLKAIEGGQIEMLKLLLEPIAAGGYGLSLNVKDNYAQGPVLRVVAYGQINMLKQLLAPVSEGGYGLSLNVKDNKGLDPVLRAVANGQMAMLKQLLAPIAVGGYNLTLNVRTNRGADPVLLAIFNNHIEILKLLLAPIAAGGYGLSLDVKENDDCGSVLKAIEGGQIEMLKLLLEPIAAGGYGLSLDVKDNYGQGPVLRAVAYGQINMLKQLLAPVSEGGYGLSLNVKDNKGLDPVLRAVANGQMAMLKQLLAPIAVGGYNLTLNVRTNRGADPVLVAIIDDHIEILKLLLAPIATGGYGLCLTNPFDLLNQINDKPAIFEVIFFHEFNRLREEDCRAAFNWGRRVYRLSPNAFDTAIKNKLAQIYNEWLNDHIALAIRVVASNEHLKHTKEIALALEELVPGEGYFLLGEAYNQIGNFIASFENYLQVFRLKSSQYHGMAGHKLASYICNGNVVINPAGTINIEASMTNASLQIWERMGTKRERAIRAYEYLVQNDDSDACNLHTVLRRFLSGGYVSAVWPASVREEFFNYYCKKNPKLLQDESYLQTGHPSLKRQQLFPKTESPNKKPRNDPTEADLSNMEDIAAPSFS